MKKKPKRAKINPITGAPDPFEVMKDAPKVFPPLFPKDCIAAKASNYTIRQAYLRMKELGLGHQDAWLAVDEMIDGTVIATRRRPKIVRIVRCIPRSSFRGLWEHFEKLEIK